MKAFIVAHPRTLIVVSLGLIISFLTGGFSGYYIGKQRPTSISEQRLNSSQYTFINPLLDTENPPNQLLNREVEELKSAINAETDKSIELGLITKGSVYYRDLNNGPWFSTGSENTFKAASLFKIPLMISIFKQAETDPSILDKVVTYEKPFENVAQHNVDSSNETIEVGKSYTVMQLIESMITNSDNFATYLLLSQVDADLVDKVFSDLALPAPGDDPTVEITPQKYSSFFRILYNATYLSPQYSEKALEILSRSKFAHGMHSVITPGVVSSTKYGIATSGFDKQFHECGIIYWNKNQPQLLCVMTTGNDYLEMANYVKNITTLVQNSVTRNH